MSLCVSFSGKGAGFCIYHLLVWSNLNFLQISQWITLPTQYYLALYSCRHSLHLLLCCDWSIFALIRLVIIIIIIIMIWVFNISISWLSFTGVWETASLLKSPGLFSSILAVFNNAVVWMVSTLPPTSKSSRPFNNPLVTVPKAPITIAMIITIMFYSFFFNSLARSRYLSLFSHFFQFYSLVCRDNFTNFLFFVDYYKIWSSGRD